jgi:hypothetical protein
MIEVKYRSFRMVILKSIQDVKVLKIDIFVIVIASANKRTNRRKQYMIKCQVQ